MSLRLWRRRCAEAAACNHRLLPWRQLAHRCLWRRPRHLMWHLLLPLLHGNVTYGRVTRIRRPTCSSMRPVSCTPLLRLPLPPWMGARTVVSTRRQEGAGNLLLPGFYERSLLPHRQPLRHRLQLSPEVLSLVAFVSKTSTMAHQASCVILPSCMPVWLSTPPCWISFGASTELYAPIQLVEGSAALGWLSAISAVGPLPRGHSVRGILFQDLPQPTPRKQHAAQLSALLQVKVHWAPVSLKTLSSPLGSLSECGSFPEAFLRSTRLLPFGCASPEPGPIRSRVSVRIYRAGHCLKRLVPDSC